MNSKHDSWGYFRQHFLNKSINLKKINKLSTNIAAVMKHGRHYTTKCAEVGLISKWNNSSKTQQKNNNISHQSHPQFFSLSPTNQKSKQYENTTDIFERFPPLKASFLLVKIASKSLYFHPSLKHYRQELAKYALFTNETNN